MRKKVGKSICAAMAAVVMVSGFWMADWTQKDTTVPELVSYIDTLDGTVTIEDEETPLASASVVKKTVTTKTNTKKVKMASKAKKSSKKTTKKTVKTSNTKVSSTQKVKTDKTVLTTTVTTLKKKSKVKTVKTTVKTTTTTTTTKLAATKASSSSSSTASGSSAVVQKTVAVRTIASKAHANVLSAFEKMGFSVKVDSTVSYSGKFDSKAQLITVQKNSDDAIYHELGHFVAFAAGNVDQSAEFKAIYQKEVSAFTGTRNNDSYIKSTPEEYFAESYQDYIERPAVLKAKRPQTYQFVVNAVSKVTDARAALYNQLYANVWK